MPPFVQSKGFQGTFWKSEFFKFALVGSLGVLINMGLLYLLTHHSTLRLEIASPIAIETAFLTNFFLNNQWTFRQRNSRHGFWSRFLRFHLVTGVAGLANYGVLLSLVHLAGWNEMLSNLFGVTAGWLINFSLNSNWTWREK